MIETSTPSGRAVRTLEQIAAWRGYPEGPAPGQRPGDDLVVPGTVVRGTPFRAALHPAREAEPERLHRTLRPTCRNERLDACVFTDLELTASGQVGLLRDPVLRKALTEYELFRASATEGQRNSRLAVSEYVRDFTRLFDYKLETDRPGTFEESTWAFQLSEIGAYDFDVMVADDAFKDAVYELREMQKFDLNWHANTLERIEAVQALLAVGGPVL